MRVIAHLLLAGVAVATNSTSTNTSSPGAAVTSASGNGTVVTAAAATGVTSAATGAAGVTSAATAAAGAGVTSAATAAAGAAVTSSVTAMSDGGNNTGATRPDADVTDNKFESTFTFGNMTSSSCVAKLLLITSYHLGNTAQLCAAGNGESNTDNTILPACFCGDGGKLEVSQTSCWQREESVLTNLGDDNFEWNAEAALYTAKSGCTTSRRQLSERRGLSTDATMVDKNTFKFVTASASTFTARVTGIEDGTLVKADAVKASAAAVVDAMGSGSTLFGLGAVDMRRGVSDTNAQSVAEAVKGVQPTMALAKAADSPDTPSTSGSVSSFLSASVAVVAALLLS